MNLDGNLPTPTKYAPMGNPRYLRSSKGYRRARYLWVAVPLLAIGACREDPSVEKAPKVFTGAWFEVSYPADFEARPSLESSTGDGYDSAFFDSPDGAATFYIYSPQWGGEPIDIALDPETERLLASESSTDGPITTTRTTIAARNGAWVRSYTTEFDDRGPTQWTIGWRYASEEVRVRYSASFTAFKESVKQFVD